VGRAIGSKRLGLQLTNLETLVTDVIETVRGSEREVQDADGHWFSLRVRPYLSIDNKVDGAVLVLVDIDTLKRSEQTILAARDYADRIVTTVREPMLILNANLRIERANRAFYDTFHVAAGETLGRFLYDLGNRQWDIPDLRRLLSTLLPEQESITDFSVEHTFEHLGPRVMLLNARTIHDPAHGVESILLAFEDVTERRQADLLNAERRRILELIANGTPAQPCFEELCLGIERIHPRVHASVVLTGDAGSISAVIAPSLPDLAEAVRTVLLGSGWIGTHTSAAGGAVTFSVVETDTRWPAEWKAFCRSLGISAVFLAPVAGVVVGRPRATVFLCFTEPQEAAARNEPLARMATDLVASVLRRDLSEEAVRESETRYRSLTQALTSVVWTTNAEGRFVTEQPMWSLFTGQTWEEYRDCGWADALHPDDRQRVRALWDEALTTHALYQSAGRVWHAATDAYRHFEARAVPVLNADGSVREWVGQISDVEDRTRAEEARGRLAAIVESSDDAIISKGLDGIITSWNAGAQRLFGYTAEEAVGRPVTMLIPPERLEEETFILQRVRKSEVVEPFDTVRRHKDGRLVDVSITVSPVRDGRGQVVGAAKIARDITTRKRAEEGLREADRHKNEFLAMLAHELRNPLAPILVSIDIIRRATGVGGSVGRAEPAVTPESNVGGHRVDHAVDVLQRQMGQMVRLVEDLLDAGRITTGKIDLRREVVELSSVVHHAVDAAEPLTERRDQDLTVTLPPVPIYVNADPTRLAQIVGNLLNNASKFTARAGHIWLTVEESEDVRTGQFEDTSLRHFRQIVIRVRDSGVGIAADRIEGIFDMFTQIDRTLERSVAGLGIGLALVKTLAEMHGGTVEATSPGIGHGSEFVVRLPIVAEAPTAPALPPMPQPVARTLRILVVDDNHDSADMLATLLKFSGHETHIAHDGLAAVEEADRLDPDVIVLDIGLPGVNGYEAARRIREQEHPDGRPLLVALTGWGQDEDRRRSEEAGFDAHLVKPVDVAALRKLLTELGLRHQKVEP
jgi:PAS domain S-box-containing protein